MWELGCALLQVSFGEFRPCCVNWLETAANLGCKLSVLCGFPHWPEWLLELMRWVSR